MDEDRETEEAIRAQQDVRDELTDLISLLDRNEDAWVVTRQVESMLQEMEALQEATSQMAEETIGRARGDLDQEDRSELDRIAQRQRDVSRQAEELTDELRERSDVLRESDARRSEALQSAARRAERSDLSRTMNEASEQIQENRLANAQQAQEASTETLRRMLEDLNEDRKARAQQLIRQLASLVESLERLVNVNEDELIKLARVPAAGEEDHLDQADERARSLIRFLRNTESVAGEARSAGSEAQRIARRIDSAADSQGRAIAALRSQDPDLQQAEFRLSESLTALKEALEFAREEEQQAREDEAREKREELRTQYTQLAERELGIRTTTEEIDPEDGAELSRRALVQARRLSVEQEEIRLALRTLLEEHPELDESILFERVHGFMDDWAASTRDALRDGETGSWVQEREELLIEALLGLVAALEEGEADDSPFEENQQQQQGGGQGGNQQQQLVPPIAELKLLKGLQEQVYRRTRRISDQVDDGEVPASRADAVLEELGQMQKELFDLGIQLLESIQEERPGPASTIENEQGPDLQETAPGGEGT